MAKKQSLEDLFASRSAERDARNEEYAKHYQSKYGTAPRILRPTDLMPCQRGLERIPTGIAMYDWAMKGGHPVGIRTGLSGHPDTGKSSFLSMLNVAHIKYYAALSPVPDDELVGLITNEGTDPGYIASQAGVPFDLVNDHLRFIATSFGEESMGAIVDALQADNEALSEYRGGDVWSYMLPVTWRLLSIDSLDAEELAEETFAGKKQEQLRVGDQARVGAQARLLAEFTRKGSKASKIPTGLVLVSQFRTKGIQSGRTYQSMHRGNAHPYFDQLEIILKGNSSKDDSTTREIEMSFNKMHVPGGANVTEGQSIKIVLRPGKGITVIDNAVAAAMQLNLPFLRTSGTWTYYQPADSDEIKMQGKNAGDVADWLEGEGLTEEIYARTMQAIFADSPPLVAPAYAELKGLPTAEAP